MVEARKTAWDRSFCIFPRSPLSFLARLLNIPHGVIKTGCNNVAPCLSNAPTIHTRTPEGGRSTVKSNILAHPNTTRTDDCLNRKLKRTDTTQRNERNASSASAHAAFIVGVGLRWYLPTTEKLVITTQHMDLGQAAILLYVWTQA